jgi:hypothetical protein
MAYFVDAVTMAGFVREVDVSANQVNRVALIDDCIGRVWGTAGGAAGPTASSDIRDPTLMVSKRIGRPFGNGAAANHRRLQTRWRAAH